jgi:adenosylhomocysteinase
MSGTASTPSTESIDSQLRWIRARMPLTAAAVARLPDLRGVRLACSMHLEEKMAPAVDGLLGRGAQVFLTTCNPSTVRDDFVAWCVARGARAQAARGMSESARAAARTAALAFAPTHLCEMGAELTAALLEPDASAEATAAAATARASVRAGLEATGSGTTRLAQLARPLPYPVFNWDDLPIKEGLHNRHMVGLVMCHAFFERTRLTFHGMRVLVVGYGLVGQGVCHAVRAYGGQVIVAERDPARALEARFAGWHVEPLAEALPRVDAVVTATGAAGVLGAAAFERLRDGAFLINVGHAAEEIDVPALLAHPHEPVAPFVEQVSLGARRVYLFAGGSMANLTAGQGDSLNAFDVTLAAMIAGIGHIVGAGQGEAPGVHMLPRAAWLPVAADAAQGASEVR